MNETRSFLQSLAIGLGKTKEEVEPFIKLLEDQWYTTKDSLKYLKKEDFDQLKIPQALRDLILVTLRQDEMGKLTPLSHQISLLQINESSDNKSSSSLLQDSQKKPVPDSGKEPESLISCDKNGTDNKGPTLIENLVPLQGFINECETIDEALEILEAKAAKHGVSFKKGNIHYYTTENKVRDRRIICAKKRRNKQKSASNTEDPDRASFDQLKSLKAQTENKDCPVFYKFTFDEKDSKMSFDKCEEVHNHPLVLPQNGLSQEMLNDLKLFNKKSKIIDIKESLEKKYNIQLNYYVVYREFRKLYPRFGDEDAKNLLKLFKEKEIFHEVSKSADEGIIQKLFFATSQMIYSYKLYGDIVLIDSTYRINHYNIPLIVYSGIDAKGCNIIFGLSLVNDETEDTHRWCLKEFFKVHKKLPKLCITDQDLALMATLDHDYPEVTYFLCQWHIIQNFKKHFSYLQNMRLNTVYDKILLLPHLKSIEQYEKDYQDILSILETKRYTKSFEYLERIYRLN